MPSNIKINNSKEAAYARAKQMGVYKGEVKAHLERHIKELGDLVNFEEKMESNFNDIYSYLNERLNIDLHDESDEYLNEASHGKLKYDFRMGWDYDTGHMIKVVYSLDNIDITDVGDFYYNYAGKKDGATHDSHLDYTRKNINKKGNNDHQSKGQKILAIVDEVTKKKLNHVKLINPFCDGINTHETTQSNIVNIRKNADKNPDNFIHEIRVGEIDNKPTFKATQWFSNVIDKSTNENLRFNKISKAEAFKNGRGRKIDNINAKDFPVFGEPDAKYITFHNPNKQQALQELYLREKDILNYLRRLKNDDMSNPNIQKSYKLELQNLRIIQHDIDTIQNGKYDLSIMKKYRNYDESVNSGLSGKQTWNFNTYTDYRPSFKSIEEAEEYRSSLNKYLIQESLDWIENFVNDEEFRENYTTMIERSSVNDLMAWMRANIRYGWRSIEDGRVRGTSSDDDDEEDFYKYYRLQSPTQLAEKKYGVCWDQCELERRWFGKHGITHAIFFIELQSDSTDLPTHTFLTYYMNDAYWWFEHSWGSMQGIRRYDNLRSLIIDVVLKHQAECRDNKSPVFVSYLVDTPNFGCTANEYMSYVHHQKQLDVNNIPLSFDELMTVNESKEIFTSGDLKDYAISDKELEEVRKRNLLKDNINMESYDDLDWIENYIIEEGENSDEPPALPGEETEDDTPPEIEDPTDNEEPPTEEVSEEETNEEEPVEEEQPKEEEPKPEEPKKESLPKQTDRAESDKNGVRRKKLYITFIEWCKEYNPKNTFGSIFDKDAFHVSYPFVPEECRYFYRLANPMLCVLGGDLTFFPVGELRKINAKNSKLNEMMIFAATPNDLRVFNIKDKKVYRATEENGTIKLNEVLGNTFDTYIQKMINKGDILNGPLEESVVPDL